MIYGEPRDDGRSVVVVLLSRFANRLAQSLRGGLLSLYGRECSASHSARALMLEHGKIVVFCPVLQTVVVLHFLSTSGDGTEPPSLPPLASPCFFFNRVASLLPIFSIFLFHYDIINILTVELSMARVEQCYSETLETCIRRHFIPRAPAHNASELYARQTLSAREIYILRI